MVFPIVKKIRGYFATAETYPLPRFIVELTLVGFFTKLAAGIVVFGIIGLFLYLTGQPQLDLDENIDGEIGEHPLLNKTFAVLVAPPVETLLGQWLPIWLTSRFTQKTWIKITVSTIFFIAQHHPLRYVVAAMLGPLLAWSFLVQRKHSFKRAFWVTTAIHALHNFISSVV